MFRCNAGHPLTMALLFFTARTGYSMTFAKRGLLAATVFLSAGAMAQGDGFVGVSWGEGSSNFHRSTTLKNYAPEARFDKIIDHSDTWSVRGGSWLGEGRLYATYDNVSDKYKHDWKVRQENLILSYDAFLPLGETTRLFGGGTAGITKIALESSGLRRDTGYGYAAGLQAGILQDLPANLQLEGGFRYTIHNAKVKAREHGVGKVGSAELKSTRLAYIGLNYRF